MIRLQIRLDETTLKVLQELARREYRDPRQEAGLLIREALEKRGLLSCEPDDGQKTILPQPSKED